MKSELFFSALHSPFDFWDCKDEEFCWLDKVFIKNFRLISQVAEIELEIF